MKSMVGRQAKLILASTFLSSISIIIVLMVWGSSSDVGMGALIKIAGLAASLSIVLWLAFVGLISLLWLAFSEDSTSRSPYKPMKCSDCDNLIIIDNPHKLRIVEGEVLISEGSDAQVPKTTGSPSGHEVR